MSTPTAKIQNVSGVDRIVPGLGDRLVLSKHVVAVPADAVTSFTQQEKVWAPYDDVAKALHQEMLDALAELLAEPEPETDPEPDAKQIVAEVIPAMQAAEDVAALLAAEQARPRPRTTVLAAAEQRLADLTAG